MSIAYGTAEHKRGIPFLIVEAAPNQYAAFTMGCDLLAQGSSWQAVEDAVRNERPDARRLGIVRSVAEGSRL